MPLRPTSYSASLLRLSSRSFGMSWQSSQPASGARRAPVGPSTRPKRRAVQACSAAFAEMLEKDKHNEMSFHESSWAVSYRCR